MLVGSALIIAIFVLIWFAYDRYGGYWVVKTGNTWKVHHTPPFIFYFHNLQTFLQMRERSFQKIAADLSDGVTVQEESFWLNGERDGARVEKRISTLSERVTQKILYGQNLYNWRPKRLSQGKLYHDVYTSEWTTSEFKDRFTPSECRRVDESGATFSMLMFLLFTHLMGITLIFFGMQLSNDMAYYDILYTALDAGVLAAADQQQVTVIQYTNGFPSLWTQELNPTLAYPQLNQLFSMNLFGDMPQNFIDNHMYFGTSSTPGYSDSVLDSYTSIMTYTYNGQMYKVGIQINNMPVTIDTNLINAAMRILEGNAWSNQIHMIYNLKASFPFLLYSPSNSTGYAP